MYSSCPTSEISSFYRGVFSNSDSNSLDYSKLCRACILVVGLKISSKHYRVLDSSEHQQSYFGTAPTGLVVCNEPVAFMMAAAAVGVVKTEGLITSVTGCFRGFHGTIVEPAHVVQQGTALLSNKIFYFSTGTRPIFNINNSKFQRAPYFVISSKTHYFNPPHDASASGAGIAVPSCQHPEVLNKEGVGEASREEEAQNRQDLKHDEIQPRGGKKMKFSLKLKWRKF